MALLSGDSFRVGYFDYGQRPPDGIKQKLAQLPNRPKDEVRSKGTKFVPSSKGAKLRPNYAFFAPFGAVADYHIPPAVPFSHGYNTASLCFATSGGIADVYDIRMASQSKIALGGTTCLST